jgi:hypothetical protein
MGAPDSDLERIRLRIILLSRYMQACIDAETDAKLAQRGMRYDRPSGSETPAQLSKRLQAALSESGVNVSTLADGKSQLKALGEKINSMGGFDLMLEIAESAVREGGNHSRIEKTWDGIGQWMA